MRTLHLDCFSGISGDMFVGALRDLGVEESVFLDALSGLHLNDEFHAHFHRESRQNVTGWKFHVHSHHEHTAPAAHSHAHSHEHAHDHGHSHSHDEDHGHTHSHTDAADHAHGRNHRQIREIISRSHLSENVKARVLAVFQRIAVAEGKIHGVPSADVGFHEVGAVDSIADIVAACAGMEALDVSRVTCSILTEGTGTIMCAHGSFPLPAPATLEILAGIPLRQIDEPLEFITPTGAALAAEFAEKFGPMPLTAISRVGYGLGTRDTPGRPNVVRFILGGDSDQLESDEITQIETNIDDLSPELAGATMERLFAQGALDVFFTPAQMKKNRPGFLLTVLATEDKVAELTRTILSETSAFGVRMARRQRLKLRREFRDVETPYGTVRIKLGFLGEELVQAAPEFESCREVATKAGVSVKDVHLAAWIGTPPKPA